MGDENLEQNNEENEMSAADKLIEEVKAKLASSETKVPDPKPAVVDTQAAYREDMKKQMGWTDAQFDTYQRDKLSTQAPMVSELSKSKIREAHKDYDTLKTAYDEEFKKYTDRGVAVGEELAEQIFWMVKGREMESGRYKVPDSQPKRDLAAGGPKEKIVKPYNPSNTGMSGSREGGEQETVQLTDEEQQYAKLTGVSNEEYAKMREEKRTGKRQITEVTYRVPKIDQGAGPADRDLVALLGRHDMKRI